MMPKSNELLWERIKREGRPIYQKVIARKYLKNVYGISFDDAIIPGKTP
jgi:hypothetical protein